MSNSCDENARRSLSAMLDGEATPAEADAACAVWRDDSQARECWHTYHLIGDVLRSQDLAARPAHDAEFMQRLSQRLSGEPRVLAPRRPRARQRRGWQAATMAVAAGFVGVTAVVLVTRYGTAPSPSGAGPVLAKTAPPELVVVDGKLIRDLQLDRYLAAHRRLSNASAVAVPGGVVRSADTIAIEGK